MGMPPAIYFLVLVTFLQFSCSSEQNPAELATRKGDVFPAAMEVQWSPSTNLRKVLLTYSSSEMPKFLQADIVMGRTASGQQVSSRFPIMALPTDMSADLSFAEWIKIAHESNQKATTKKGLKLNFRDIDSVEPTLKILQETLANQANYEIWLNADIVDGPGSPKYSPLNQAQFLAMTRSFPLKHTLSLGWTVGTENDNYTWQNALDMMSFVNELPSTTPVVYSVQLSKLTLEPLSLLLTSTYGLENTALWRNMSLYVWMAPNNAVKDFAALSLLHYRFPGKIFLDIPVLEKNMFRKHLTSTTYKLPSRVYVVQSEVKIQVYPYSVITHSPGLITLRTQYPSTFHLCRILDGGREQATTGTKNKNQTTLRIGNAGGKVALYTTFE